MGTLEQEIKKAYAIAVDSHNLEFEMSELAAHVGNGVLENVFAWAFRAGYARGIQDIKKGDG